MNTKLWRELITEAELAPSVHNVQPARWRIEDEKVTMFEDLGVRLTAADPEGHDAEISLGAAFEGLSLAASKRRLALKCKYAGEAATGNLRPVLTVEIAGERDRDLLADHVECRKSWRGAFLHHTDHDSREASKLDREDCQIFVGTQHKDELADLMNAASLYFMRDAAFRRELTQWMRLRQSHPRWSRDGLNAESMQLTSLEAMGVPLVLGPAFPILDKIMLADPLLSEKVKIHRAAAIAVFHRPDHEKPFECGRHFYRSWLRFEAAGFGASVLAALADHRPTADKISEMAGLGADRRLVSAFRIGRRPKDAIVGRARRGLDEILVS